MLLIYCIWYGSSDKEMYKLYGDAWGWIWLKPFQQNMHPYIIACVKGKCLITAAGCCHEPTLPPSLPQPHGLDNKRAHMGPIVQRRRTQTAAEQDMRQRCNQITLCIKCNVKLALGNENKSTQIPSFCLFWHMEEVRDAKERGDCHVSSNFSLTVHL